MKKITVCALVLILLFVFSVSADENPKEAELLFMAKKAYEDGFYEVSLGMLERFLKDFSGSACQKEARLLSGQSYFQQGRYLEALNIFESLLNDPQCANFKDAIYFWMAEVHFKGNNLEKSALLYRKLLDEFPLSSYAAPAYYSIGWSLSETGKYGLALEAFVSLLEKFPDEPQSRDAAFKIIECLYNLKKYSELESKVESVLKLYNKDKLRLPYLYFYLAESEYYLDNFEAAAKDYLLSAQDVKDEGIGALAKLGLGWSYLKLAKYKEAEEVFADISESRLDKKSLDTLILGKAVLMSQSNRVYEAKGLYERVINVSRDPLMRMQAYLGKADALYSLAEYKQAVDAYKEGLDKINNSTFPDELTGRMRYNLALAYLKAGQIVSGIDIFEDILKKSKDSAASVNILLQIGDAYERIGEFIKAEEAYMSVLKLYPDSSYVDYAQYQLGSLKIKRNDYEGAIVAFGIILKNYPQSYLLADVLYSLGEVYFQKADYANSFKVFSRFQSEFKDSPLRSEALHLLGSTFVNQGKINEALAVFKDIIRLYSQDIELRQRAEYQIADCYYKLGQEKEALKQLKALRTKYPDSKLAPDIMWWLGQYYYRANEAVLASRYFNALIKEFPASPLRPEAFYVLGLILSSEGKFDQAADNFKKALELGSEATSIRFKFAEALEANSEFEGAIREYLLAAELDKQDAHSSVLALLRVARIYEEKEKFPEALEVYKRVILKNTQEANFAQERVEWINSKN